MGERERMARQERVGKAIGKAVEIAEVLADEFIETKSVEQLVERVREEQQSIDSEYGENTSNIAFYITDRIQERWDEGNGIIVDSARKMGIEPHTNYFGVRLQAMDCLTQILSERETSSKEHHPPL